MVPIFASSSMAKPALPIRSIPGSYGLPFIGPLKDRLDYFWFQGPDTFFRRRMADHNSTVFRTNMPPTFPFFVGIDSRVVAVVDCSAFATLFDNSLIDKRDILIGAYMPSLKFTGGTRVGVYRDTTEPEHNQVKSFCMEILRRSSSLWESEFLRCAGEMFSLLENEIANKSKASVLVPLQRFIFSFLCKAIAGADVSSSKEIADWGFATLDKWLALQLLPTLKLGILQPLEEIFLHSFPYPFFLVAGGYNKLYNFFEKEGRQAIELADTYGIGEKEAINNILFILGFNAYGGFSVFLPSLITTIGKNNVELQAKLRQEVRDVLGDDGLPCFETVKKMELVKSTVYEILRMNPPVPLQFGRARQDFDLSSNDATFQVKKGEVLCGYQPLAMRDPKVFDNPEKFIPDRFAKNKNLLKYLFWSNGPQTGTPGPTNKQCAAKDYVTATACMFVAEIFRRYDEFECDGSLSFTKMEPRKRQ